MSSLTIETRSQWGAQAPKDTAWLRSFTSGWFIHWNGPAVKNADAGVERERAMVRAIQRFHMNPKPDGRGWDDIAYSFLVGQSGRAYRGRGWGVAGAHTAGYNSTGMGICFLIGMGQTPTEEAIQTATRIMADGHDGLYKPHRVRPHRAVADTACPGDDLARWATNFNIENGDLDMINPYEVEVNEALHLLAEHAGYEGDFDGWFGPIALAAFHRWKNEAGPNAELGHKIRELVAKISV